MTQVPGNEKGSFVLTILERCPLKVYWGNEVLVPYHTMSGFTPERRVFGRFALRIGRTILRRTRRGAPAAIAVQSVAIVQGSMTMPVAN